jgi:hypothetical protein
VVRFTTRPSIQTITNEIAIGAPGAYRVVTDYNSNFRGVIQYTGETVGSYSACIQVANAKRGNKDKDKDKSEKENSKRGNKDKEKDGKKDKGDQTDSDDDESTSSTDEKRSVSVTPEATTN